MSTDVNKHKIELKRKIARRWITEVPLPIATMTGFLNESELQALEEIRINGEVSSNLSMIVSNGVDDWRNDYQRYAKKALISCMRGELNHCLRDVEKFLEAYPFDSPTSKELMSLRCKEDLLNYMVYEIG